MRAPPLLAGPGLGQAPGQGLKAQAVLFCLDSSPWRRGGAGTAREARYARPDLVKALNLLT